MVSASASPPGASRGPVAHPWGHTAKSKAAVQCQPARQQTALENKRNSKRTSSLPRATGQWNFQEAAQNDRNRNPAREPPRGLSFGGGAGTRRTRAFGPEGPGGQEPGHGPEARRPPAWQRGPGAVGRPPLRRWTRRLMSSRPKVARVTGPGFESSQSVAMAAPRMPQPGPQSAAGVGGRGRGRALLPTSRPPSYVGGCEGSPKEREGGSSSVW